MIALKQLFLFFLFLGIYSCHKKEEIVIDPSLTRDAAAYQITYPKLKKALSEKDIIIDEIEIYLRAFKSEEKLEVWIKEKSDLKFQLFKSYDFCKSSGKLGPKRKEGDYQIPEGLYHISVFNPTSNFHLSLGINYPNESDKILSDPEHPGNHIYIHGGCMTIGCIPITNPSIKELYTFCSIAKNGGQAQIPVHIFPFKMNQQNISKFSKTHSKHRIFWSSISPFYTSFEKQQTLPTFSILENGLYKTP